MFSANSSQVSDDKLFVEDVFSTWLYSGNGGTQTIVNGIDLAGKEGLLWIKARSNDTSAPDHYLMRKSGSSVFANISNNTSAQQTVSPYVQFNSNGFLVNAAPGFLNNSSQTYASWTFRKAPKFFDVVTWTGDGATFKTINHNLGIEPGMIVVKRTNGPGTWYVYHRSTGQTSFLILNGTNAAITDASGIWNATSTTFDARSFYGVNGSGDTYIAYLYAHDATSDGVIQCGSYTGNGSATGPVVTLGWEPQWLMIKNASDIGQWNLVDNMRRMSVQTSASTALLYANLSNSEAVDRAAIPLATGFQINDNGSAVNTSGATYVYIAIRRGPMRTPTLGTSVFSPDFFGGGTRYYNSGFPTDMAITNLRAGDSFNNYTIDRLRGDNNGLRTHSTSAETADPAAMFDNMVGIGPAYTGGTNSGYIGWLFRRAPGFMDVVCYTGTGVARTLNHNLGVAPELMIVKSRNATYSWTVYANALGASQYLILQSTIQALTGSTPWNATNPTSTVFSVGTAADTNTSGSTYVAYLFASCPGVSKVGSYTGNGSSQTINCAFAAGARFVMIKRTDSTGDWYVWDTARGIVAGNDPHLSLNTTAAEVTTDDTIDTDSSGFVVNQVAATNVNVNAATYIYLAIA